MCSLPSKETVLQSERAEDPLLLEEFVLKREPLIEFFAA